MLTSQLSRLLTSLTLYTFPSTWSTYIPDLSTLLSTSLPSATAGWKGLIGTIEDCCDGDFNSRVTQKRRNDVLQGMHEVREKGRDEHVKDYIIR